MNGFDVIVLIGALVFAIYWFIKDWAREMAELDRLQRDQQLVEPREHDSDHRSAPRQPAR